VDGVVGLKGWESRLCCWNSVWCEVRIWTMNTCCFGVSWRSCRIPKRSHMILLDVAHGEACHGHVPSIHRRIFRWCQVVVLSAAHSHVYSGLVPWSCRRMSRWCHVVVLHATPGDASISVSTFFTSRSFGMSITR